MIVWKIKIIYLRSDRFWNELEDILIQWDIGMDMTVKIVGALEKKKRGIKDPKDIYPV